MENQASAQIKKFFQECSDKYGKLFIPDDSKDDGIVNNLISYYRKYHDKETLEACIDYYVRTTVDPILIYNFAIESGTVREKVLQDRESKKEYNRLLKETQKRMKGINELRN